MATVQYFIRGRVQGVGFRRFVLHHAMQLGLRGFVTNNDDGSVECVAQGDVADINTLEMLLRQGPIHSEVTDVECVDLETSSRIYTGFRIL
ncbi:MAG: acylphosphatase [Bradyrhizobiaceae bacterium]|nr:acylphosphatase [Bradyrhizobiaceae bacterium]